MSRGKTHEYRQVTGRAFTLHLRCFAKSLDKLNKFLILYQQEVENILFNLKGEKFDRKLGVKGMASEILKTEKSSLEGVQAHAREIKVFAKYLGLIRTENLITSRGETYLKTVRSGGDYRSRLRDYVMKIKIECPLIRNYLYKKGHRQASYANYRIRVAVMVLHAIKKAKEYRVDIDTDDLALTALLFYPPFKQNRVSEEFLMLKIDEYLKEKARKEIDYEQRFRELYLELLAETGASPDEDEFKQKLRNSANNVWCFLIFLREIGLIECEDSESSHWSSTRQIPISSSTFEVGYQLLGITNVGERMLKEAMKFVPIWYKDIKIFILLEYKLRSAIEMLVNNGKINEGAFESDVIESLEKLGLSFTKKGSEYIADRRPLFTSEYDIP